MLVVGRTLEKITENRIRGKPTDRFGKRQINPNKSMI